MPRPQKKRYVCCLPKSGSFTPDIMTEGDVILTVDEYETIRLIDLEEKTQEECAGQMHVARTTVQAIYNQARLKVADALVNGKRLTISGGDYKLCEQYEKKCGFGCHDKCHRHRCRLENQ